MSDVIGKGVIEVSADSSKLKAGINDAKKSINSLGVAVQQSNSTAARSIDNYVRRLQTQAAVQGKSTREAELYKLALRGASNEQIAAANAALRLAEGYERGAAIGNRLRTGFIALGAAAATGLIAAAVAFDRLIKKAGDFQDMAEKTGDTAVNIASLAVAAGTAGVGMETVVSASTKLTKGLTGVDDESKDAGAAVAALGLNLKTFKELNAADQLEAVAKAMAGFEEGTAKTAVAMALFGKSGAELLPFLKELGQEGGRQNILTAEQIRLADEYSDKQAKLRTEIGLHAQAIATDLLPALNDFTQTIADLARDQEFAATASDLLKGALNGAIVIFQTIAVVGSEVGFVFKGVGREIGGMLAQLDALARWDFKGFTAISDAMKADADKARAELDRFQARVMGMGGGAPAPGVTAGDFARQDRVKKKPQLNFNGKADKAGKGDREAEQTRRAQLDRDIKSIRDALQKEKDAVAFHERYLQSVYQAGEISLKDFYDAKRGTIAEGVAAEIALLEKERTRLEQHLAGTKDPSQKVATQTKIDDVENEIGRVRLAAGRDIVLANKQEEASFKALNDQVADYRATLLEMQGDELGAARLRSSRAIEQVKELAKRSQSSDNPISDEQIDAFIRAQGQQRELNAVKTQTSFINQRLAIEEERIALAQRTGSIGEIAALERLGTARAKAASELEKKITDLEKLAKERPLDIQLTIDTEQARQQLEDLQASLDPLKEKFDNLFKDSGANFFADLMNGKKPNDALKSFFASISAEISSVASKELAQQVFGKDGILGGLGGIFADGFRKKDGNAPADAPGGGIFGGLKNNPAKPTLDTSAVTTSLSTLQTTGIDPTTSALVRLADAAETAANAVGKSQPGEDSAPLTTGDFARLDRASTPELTTGDFARMDRGQPTGETSVMDMFRDASRESNQFAASSADAAQSVLQLARAAGKGGDALSLIPRIIATIQAISTASSAGSSSGNFLGSIFSAFSGGGGSSVGGGGNFFLSEAAFLHSGGIVGTGTDKRPVNPSVFNDAPRYHSGGIAGQVADRAGLKPNEVPAILMGGPKGTREEVLHADDPRHRDNLTPSMAKVFDAAPRYHTGGLVGQKADRPEQTGAVRALVKGESRQVPALFQAIKDAPGEPGRAFALSIVGGKGGDGGKGGAGMGHGGRGGDAVGGNASAMNVTNFISGAAPTATATNNTNTATDKSTSSVSSLLQNLFSTHSETLNAGGTASNVSHSRASTVTNQLRNIADNRISAVTEGDRHSTLTNLLQRVGVAEPDVPAGLSVSIASMDAAPISGARALGGPVSAGGMYRVNETRPELLEVAGKQYLMMGAQGGNVTPNDMGGGGDTYNVNVTAGPGVTPAQAMNQGRNIRRGLVTQMAIRTRDT